MPSLLIENGRILDPGERLDCSGHVVVRDGIIAYIGSDASQAAAAAGPEAQRFNASDMLVVPGLLDMHVHFREPGNKQEETIASGAAAAVAGGFTSVACMPNTDPPVDNEAAVLFTRRESRRTGLANVFPVGAITAGRKGVELAEMSQMARGGAVAFSDDGKAVPTAGLLRKALAYAKMLDRPILEHCEDPSLSDHGVMDEGYESTILGLQGIPDEAEEVIVARDIAMARITGAHLHVQHVSTANSVEIIRRAKASGVKVTAEVTAHHLTLTSALLRGYDPVFKVNPPLRAVHDVEACRRGLKDGTLDVIASDHAPHLQEEKELEIPQAPFGLIGLETTLGVLLTDLVGSGEFTIAELLPALTCNPSDILQLDRGRIRTGLPGDITIIDPGAEWVVEPEKFKSRSRNCPFRGKRMRGRAVATIVGGSVVYRSN